MGALSSARSQIRNWQQVVVQLPVPVAWTPVILSS
jgi:hypothetical protein